MDIQKILPYQRSLFILGDVGSERYALLQQDATSYPTMAHYWKIEDSLFKTCTWILFSADTPMSLEWTADGLKQTTSIQTGGTYCIAVKPGNLPLNTKLILPPYFQHEAQFKQYYENNTLKDATSTYIWFEGFPYGKADTVKHLRYLQDIGISKKQLSLAITQIERDFVITDIGNQTLGIENAKTYFQHKGYRILSTYAMMPVQRDILREALNVEQHSIENIIFQKQEILKNIEASIIFVEDDLRFAFEREAWIVKLEYCFAYKHVRMQKVYDVWIQQLHKLFEETVIVITKQELIESYQLEEIVFDQDLTQVLKSITKVLWNELERKLKIEKRKKALTTSYDDPIEYEMQTHDVKGTFYKCINDIIQRRLPIEVTRYLQLLLKKYSVTIEKED